VTGAEEWQAGRPSPVRQQSDSAVMPECDSCAQPLLERVEATTAKRDERANGAPMSNIAVLRTPKLCVISKPGLKGSWRGAAEIHLGTVAWALAGEATHGLLGEQPVTIGDGGR
jgi:hypothetical protein